MRVRSPQRVCEAFFRLAVPPNVYEKRVNITAGRGARFHTLICTDKADKSCKDFLLLLPRFSFKQRKCANIIISKIEQAIFVPYKNTI
jgi:hypothetical protein